MRAGQGERLSNMSTLSKRASLRKTPNAKDPRSSAALTTPIHNGAPIAARKIADRFGISIDFAITVVRLAGLGESEVR